MKKSIGVATLSVIAMASGLLAYDGSQRQRPATSETSPVTGTTRDVQAGKGAGMPRRTEVPANAYREETSQDKGATRNSKASLGEHDTAFHK